MLLCWRLKLKIAYEVKYLTDWVHMRKMAVGLNRVFGVVKSVEDLDKSTAKIASELSALNVKAAALEVGLANLNAPLRKRGVVTAMGIVLIFMGAALLFVGGVELIKTFVALDDQQRITCGPPDVRPVAIPLAPMIAAPGVSVCLVSPSHPDALTTLLAFAAFSMAIILVGVQITFRD